MFVVDPDTFAEVEGPQGAEILTRIAVECPKGYRPGREDWGFDIDSYYGRDVSNVLLSSMASGIGSYLSEFSDVDSVAVSYANDAFDVAIAADYRLV